MKLGVLSDTHIPRHTRFLPGVIFHAFRDVDLILHAGDILEQQVLDELAALAPVKAVHGNVDPPELVEQLPTALLLELEGFRIGLTHGHGGAAGKTAQQALGVFQGDNCDCIVFGHSHQPYAERHGDVLLFNPGSPTDTRREPYPTFGTIKLGSGLDARIFQFEPESNMIIGGIG